MTRDVIHKKMVERGWELQLSGGSGDYFHYTNHEYRTIGCTIVPSQETFQFVHVTAKNLTLKTGECGSFMNDVHFHTHYMNMVHYIANGD